MLRPCQCLEEHCFSEDSESVAPPWVVDRIVQGHPARRFHHQETRDPQLACISLFGDTVTLRIERRGVRQSNTIAWVWEQRKQLVTASDQ